MDYGENKQKRIEFKAFSQSFLKYKSISNESYQFGTAKLFLKAGFYNQVEEMMALKDPAIIKKITADMLKWIVKKRWRSVHVAYQVARKWMRISDAAKQRRATHLQCVIRRALKRVWAKAEIILILVISLF